MAVGSSPAVRLRGPTAARRNLAGGPSAAVLGLLAVFCITAAPALGQTVYDDTAWQIKAANKDDAKLQSQRYLQVLGTNGDQGLLNAWWNNYKKVFGKGYASSAAETAAKAAFTYTLALALRVNQDATIPHWVAPSKYSDMDYASLKSTMLMNGISMAGRPRPVDNTTAVARRSLKARRSLQGKTPAPAPSTTTSAPAAGLPGIPNSRDWRKAGVVTPVRDQGSCGSCWAHAATSSIESVVAIVTGKMMTLSVKNLMDCATAAAGWGSNGCAGGYSDGAMSYVHALNQTLDTKYPYAPVQGTCNQAAFTDTTSLVRLGGKNPVTYPIQFDENALILSVDRQPTVVYMDVQASFQSYSGGVYKPTDCSTNVNHAVVVVGYVWTGQTDGSYWIIQNSWGTSWGEDGYAKVAMTGNGNGPCGIYMYPMAPIKSIAARLTTTG